VTSASGATGDRAEWSAERATEIVLAHAGVRGPVLPVLHALQEEFGYLDPRAVPLVATLLNLSRADVHGVVTFYRDFRDTPPAPVGGHELAEHAAGTIGADFGGTSPDGAVGLDQVFCLGNCALGPSVTVDGALHGRVDPARLDALVGQARSRAGVPA